MAVVCVFFEFAPFLLMTLDDHAYVSAKPFDVVLSLSFLMVPVSVVALILAGIAWVRIKRSGGRRVGAGLSVAAMVLVALSDAVFAAVWINIARNFKLW